MRYAIVSDLHANRQALKAVLNDISCNGIDQIICLGDVVGYGPNPAEVLELAYSKIHHFILGNHDAVIGGKLSTQHFNDTARGLIEWTHQRLDGKAAKFFKSLPLEAVGENIRCAHGEFADPGRFGYILECEDASASFSACAEQVMFAGHSHVPGLFVLGKSGIPHWLEPVDFGIEEEKRYIVNVGSVGQPRDNDIRASYCIYDAEKKDVVFRKIAFDVDEYVAELQKVKIPESTAYFVDVYRKQSPRPIRELIDFKRVNEESTVKAGADAVDLQKTVKKLKLAKLALAAVLTASIIAVSALALVYSAQKKEISRYQKTSYEALKADYAGAVPVKIGDELAPLPEKAIGEVSPSGRLEHWSVIVSDPEKQKVSVKMESDDKSAGQICFAMSSGINSEMLISSPAVPAEKGMRFSGSAYFKGGDFESGHVEMILEAEYSDGTRKLLENNIIDELRAPGKWTRRRAVSLNKGGELKEDCKIRFSIRGQFKGEILVRNCSLKRTE